MYKRQGEGGVGRRLIGPLAALGTETEARAPYAVEQDGLAGVGSVELPGRVGHEQDVYKRQRRLLRDADGQPTELCQGIRQGYAAVMVDEYQDTNALQDALYRCLASPAGDDLFLVGDLKQSIYLSLIHI